MHQGRAATPEEVLSFWLDEIGEAGWYAGGDDLDARIATRFEDLWTRAASGSLSLWLTYPNGTLAYLILTDQFPRNMFRGTECAFATDRIALTAAGMAVHRDWDLRVHEPARQFFYLPFMHSESLRCQDRGVRLMKDRLPETGASNLLHARAHREVIRRFGRFPYRNDALNRETTEAEAHWMEDEGYGGVVRRLEAGAGA